MYMTVLHSGCWYSVGMLCSEEVGLASMVSWRRRASVVNGAGSTATKLASDELK